MGRRSGCLHREERAHQRRLAKEQRCCCVRRKQPTEGIPEQVDWSDTAFAHKLTSLAGIDRVRGLNKAGYPHG